jgi:hypothetical protein
LKTKAIKKGIKIELEQKNNKKNKNKSKYNIDQGWQ